MASYPVHSFGADAFMQNFMAQRELRMQRQKQMADTVMNQAKMGALDSFSPQILQQFQQANPAMYQVAKSTDQKAKADMASAKFDAGMASLVKTMDVYSKLEAQDMDALAPAMSSMGNKMDQIAQQTLGISLNWNSTVGGMKEKRKVAADTIAESLSADIQKLGVNSTTEDLKRIKGKQAMLTQLKWLDDTSRKEVFGLIDDQIQNTMQEKQKKYTEQQNIQASQQRIREATQTRGTDFTLKNGRTINTTYENALRMQAAGQGTIGTEPPKLKGENPETLRKEFLNFSKTFVNVRDSYNRVQASAEKASAAGDLALIFNYMKILDPGSVVRESEFATAQNAAGVPDRVRAMYNRVLSGKKLADDQRADFVERAGMLYKKQEETQQGLIREYSRLATQQGIDPSNVIVDFLSSGLDSSNPPPTDKLQEGTVTNFANGQQWTLQGGKPKRLK